MRWYRLVLPSLRLLESPTEELARLSLRQVRAENGFVVHLATWLAGSAWLVVLNLLTERETPFSVAPISIWAAIVFFHGRRARVGRRRAYEARHRALHAEHQRERRSAARETGVALLRRKLLAGAEEARMALRTDSPQTVVAVSQGEAEALSLVAWLAEAEGLMERHRVDPRLRRKVAKLLSDPRNQAAREPLTRLLALLDLHDSRLAALEREATRRRSRVESFLLAIENVKIAHSSGGLVPEVSASVSRRAALLAAGETGTGRGESARETAARIREEVRLARDLQRSILPGGAPAVPGLGVAHLYRPSSEVGGDFYDFYAPGPGRLLVAVGDASGHGLDSSMVSSMAKSALYTQISAGHDLARSMAEINRMMCDTLGRRRFMTLALLEIDLGRRCLAWANAGQVYPLLRRGAEVRELEQPGYPLGVRRERDYPVQEVDLERGDLLLLLTDGYVEAVDETGEPHGWARLVDRVRGLEDGNPARVVKSLFADLTGYTGPAPLADDVTLIAIHYQP
ncbi:MAG TPA: SpoIIE family protein phosphatase [Thermoanaerobaculia bacterium]